MSAPPAPAQSRRIQSRSILDWFQRNNVVALVLLLLLFVVAVELLKPGTVNFGMAVEHAPLRGAIGGSRRWSDHGHVDRRDRSVGRQRRHGVGVL